MESSVVKENVVSLPYGASVGSKEISIRRRELLNSHLPVPVRNNAITKISSVFGKGNSPLRGLTQGEERRWLPEIIGVSPNDQSWQRKITNFWADLSITVKSAGVVLQIGFTENGEPINLMDYIKYRFCLVHPQVAPDESTMKSNLNLMFHIYDPNVENKVENKNVALKRSAYIEFAKISGDNVNLDKMKRVIRLISDVNPDNYSAIEAENILSTIIDQDPEKFYRICKDKDLDVKATIHSLVEHNILRKIGSTYLYMDSTIGNTLDETVLFIKKPENSGVIAEIKAKMQEVR